MITHHIISYLSIWSINITLHYITHRFLVFIYSHVITTQCHNKENGTHIIEALDPLPPLRPLSPNVKHPVTNNENETLKHSLSQQTLKHSLSQQGVWVSFGHPNPQRSPLRTPKYFCESFLKMSISSIYN